jgi:D-glucuronyl C5-epimerase-like protein
MVLSAPGSSRFLDRQPLVAVIVVTAAVLGAALPLAGYRSMPGGFVPGHIVPATSAPRPIPSAAPSGPVAQATLGPTTLKAPTKPSLPEWPVWVPSDKEKAAGLAAQSEFKGPDYRVGFQQYSARGDYLNYGAWLRYRAIPDLVVFDGNGIPMVWYGDAFYYNPAFVAEHALSLYGRYTRGEPTLTSFRTAIDRLLTMQDQRGAFLYGFPYRYMDTLLEPGWTSGLAQAYGLSALARAALLFGDARYLDAGDRALEYLTTPVSSGGVMDSMSGIHGSLADFVFFQEAVASPPTYVLNGYMFALLGLYDWSQLGRTRASAQRYFERGVVTLSNILPYYDLGAFSAYDLQHITYARDPHVAGDYHPMHIYQLHALASISNLPALSAFELAWRRYVD